MISRRQAILGSVAVLAAQPLFAAEPPYITRVVVYKDRRKLYLLSGDQVVRTFKVSLGNAPSGPKQFEGDGKTPEGSYIINRRNERSRYHLSLGISYPTVAQVNYAASQGRRAGGDIFIHGRAGENRGKPRDWTAGCIAVRDDEIEEIWKLVADGTQIDIHP